MNQFLLDILRQLTGRRFRSGRLSIGYYANMKMKELGLDEGTLEDVFRHGRKVEMLVQNYGTYSVGIN